VGGSLDLGFILQRFDELFAGLGRTQVGDLLELVDDREAGFFYFILAFLNAIELDAELFLLGVEFVFFFSDLLELGAELLLPLLYLVLVLDDDVLFLVDIFFKLGL
jgi:hypothetical protein